MRIVIDYQGAQGASKLRGIGRYTSSFTKGLITAAQDHECILALNSALPEIELIRDEFDSLLPQSSIRTYRVDGPCSFLNAGNDLRRLSSECAREAFFKSLRPDVVVHTTMIEGLMDDVVTSLGRLKGGPPAAVLFYDLIPLIYPRDYLKTAALESWYFEKLSHLRKADLLLSISEASRLDAIGHGVASPDSVVNISAAIDPDFSMREAMDKDLLLQKFGVAKPFLLYIGSSDARKNLRRLVEAYASLPEHIRKAYQLVLGGAIPPEHISELKDLTRGTSAHVNDLVFTGPLHDKEIISLYRNARGFILPSYHEGFGLPVLEAMHFGLPLVAANTSSLPEVVGLGEALFNPHDVHAMSAAIAKVLTDESFRHLCKAHFSQRIGQFNWDKTSRRALAALKSRFAPSANKVLSGFSQPEGSRRVGTAVGALDDVARIRIASPECNRVYVDTTVLNETDSGTGIQRVVRNILAHLPGVCGLQYEVVPVTWSNDGYRLAERVARKIPGAYSSDDEQLFVPRHGDIFLGLDLNFGLIGHELFFQHLRETGVEVYFVVYDLLPLLLPDCFDEGVREAYPKWFRLVCQSHGLIGISRSVAEEIREAQHRFGCARKRPLKIGFFHLGANFSKAGGVNGGKVRHSLCAAALSTAFLVVGTVEPRKAYGQILDAFELLWSQGFDYELVVVGKRGWLANNLIMRMQRVSNNEARFHWIEDANDAELIYLYEQSRGLIAASFGEGFGLPLVEAMVFGKPIVARDLPVFREVAGDHAIYFSGNSGQSIAQAICHLNQRSEVVRRSTSLKMLTWLESAQKLWGVLHGGDWHNYWLPPEGWRGVGETQPAHIHSVRRDPMSLGQRLDAFVHRVEPRIPAFVKTAARKILYSAT
jgi:glycosyltransferase involved in cell wall biosynthesis